MLTGSRWMPLLAVLMLPGCGTAHMTQPQWVDAMRETYTPGMSMDVIETSVTRAGMRFEVERDVRHRLPRDVIGDGSGSWRRITKVEDTPGCAMSRTLYMRFDDAEELVSVYPGISRCV